MNKSYFKILLMIMVLQGGFQAAFAQHYDFSKAGKVWYLPDILAEVSGIIYLSNRQLACIQDENGIIFHYDLDTSKIVTAIDFGKRGDYEDLARLEDVYYILKSNGTLYRVKQKQKKWDVDKIKGRIKAREFEALCADPVSGNMLLCPKGKVKNKKDKSIVLYELQIKKKKMQISHLFTLKKSEYAPMIPGIEKGDFKISGMAVHPKTREIYLVSAGHFKILVISPKGKLVRVYELDPLRFPQAEGICFSPEGILFLANEAKFHAATITAIHPE